MLRKYIVIMHGWGARTSRFEGVSRFLRKNGWKVYTPKLPGFELPNPKKAYFLDDYADFVYSSIPESFKKGFFIFGHSFGGRVAIKMYGRRGVLGLILCSSGGLSRPPSVKRTFFAFLSKLGRIFMVFPPAYRIFRRLLYKAARESDYLKTEGTMRQTFKNIISEDLRGSSSLINIPTLILWGDMDRMTPVADAYFLNEAVKGSKLVVFKGVGHKLPYDKPRQIATQISKWHKSIH